MAKLKKNELLKGLRGKVGGLVFRLMPDGSTVVSRAPTRKKKKGTPAPEGVPQRDLQGPDPVGQVGPA